MMRGLTLTQQNMLFALFSQQNTPEMLTEAQENPQTKRRQTQSGKASDNKKKQKEEVEAPLETKKRQGKTKDDKVEDETVTETNNTTESEVSTAPAYYKFLKHVIDSTIT